MKKSRNMIALWIGIIGGMLAIVSAVLQHKEKKEEEAEKNVQQQKAEEYQKKFENLLLEQKDSISEVKKLNEELLEAERKNSKLTNELNKYIVGGDGIPRIQLITRRQRDGKFIVAILMINDDSRPIHQVECHARDIDDIPFHPYHIHNFGTISGGITTPPFDIPNITPRNGRIFMDISIRWTLGQYKYTAVIEQAKDSGNWYILNEDYIYNSKHYKPEQLFPNIP